MKIAGFWKSSPHMLVYSRYRVQMMNDYKGVIRKLLAHGTDRVCKGYRYIVALA